MNASKTVKNVYLISGVIRYMAVAPRGVASTFIFKKMGYPEKGYTLDEHYNQDGELVENQPYVAYKI